MDVSGHYISLERQHCCNVTIHKYQTKRRILNITTFHNPKFEIHRYFVANNINWFVSKKPVLLCINYLHSHFCVAISCGYAPDNTTGRYTGLLGELQSGAINATLSWYSLSPARYKEFTYLALDSRSPFDKGMIIGQIVSSKPLIVVSGHRLLASGRPIKSEFFWGGRRGCFEKASYFENPLTQYLDSIWPLGTALLQLSLTHTIAIRRAWVVSSVRSTATASAYFGKVLYQRCLWAGGPSYAFTCRVCAQSFSIGGVHIVGRPE